MSLNITFCGPNLEINESLMGKVYDLLYSDSVDITKLDNPIPFVMQQSGREKVEGKDSDWINLWSASIRRMRLESLVQDNQTILSASCGIDQLVYQASYTEQLLNRIQGGLLLVDSKNQPISGPEEALLNRANSVLQVILNSTEEEMAYIWNFVYAVLPVNATGETAALVRIYKEFIQAIPMFQGVILLPENEEAAEDALANEVEKWKKLAY